MKTKLIAALLPCIIVALQLAFQQLNAQVAGLPIDPSQISSGQINSGIYDINTTDGQSHTGFIDSRVDSSGNGIITSWPDGGSVTTTIVHDGNAVIYGPSR
jgi:hypothetical protein